MTRAAPRAILLDNHIKKIPYEGQKRQVIGTEKRLRPCLKSVLIDEGLLRQNNFKKHNGHVIEYLLTELGRVERGNIWLSVRTHGPRHVFLSGPHHYTFLENCPPPPPLSQHFARSER